MHQILVVMMYRNTENTSLTLLLQYKTIFFIFVGYCLDDGSGVYIARDMFSHSYTQKKHFQGSQSDHMVFIGGLRLLSCHGDQSDGFYYLIHSTYRNQGSYGCWKSLKTLEFDCSVFKDRKVLRF